MYENFMINLFFIEKWNSQKVFKICFRSVLFETNTVLFNIEGILTVDIMVWHLIEKTLIIKISFMKIVW